MIIIFLVPLALFFFLSFSHRPLRLQEILEEIENWDDASGEDEDEMKESENLITVYIQPPVDGNETEEDSGDEDHVEIRNLPGSQLLSEGEYRTHDLHSAQEDLTLRVDAQENPPQPSSSKSTSKKSGKCGKKQLRIRQWHVDDIPCMEIHTCYPYRPSIADLPRQPHEIFELFLDTLAIERLTKDTVMYAVQHGNHTFQLSSNEMKVFISILLLSGYNTLPRRRLYWSMEPDVRNELIASSMRRNRFDEIMKHLHAADNTNLDREDKFAKVRPILDILNERFLKYGEVFGPTSISIDESMVPYYGSHPTKQFIRGKPIRWGYKAWVAASPLGYSYFIDLYQGKHQMKSDSCYKDTYGLGGEVVLNMLDRLESLYPGRKFSIFFDNFFTSIRLLEAIKERGHSATGTVRSNRTEKCPLSNAKQFEKRPRGSEEHFLEKDSGISVVMWNDNGVVTIASTHYGVQPVKQVQRWSVAERKRVMIPMPSVIGLYNSNMGGVDRLDQNVAKYRVAIRGKKWYIPILSLLNVCMNNAWLFAREGGYKEDLLTFTRDVVQYQLKKYGVQPSNPGRQRMLTAQNAHGHEERYDNKGHHISKSIPESRRRCRQCKSQTIYVCNKCSVPLHVKCSFDYHKSPL